MPQERFDQLWETSRTPVCDTGRRLARAFPEACEEAVEVQREDDLDVTRFSFNRAWFDYSRHRKSCVVCLGLWV